jgi:hypothetical protein
MIVGVDLEKEPAEVWTWGVDFTDVLGVGESVNSAVFSAIQDSDGSDATTALKQGTTAVVTPSVMQDIKSGAHGETYVLKLVATTSLSHVWVAQRRLIVRQLPKPVPPP